MGHAGALHCVADTQTHAVACQCDTDVEMLTTLMALVTAAALDV